MAHCLQCGCHTVDRRFNPVLASAVIGRLQSISSTSVDIKQTTKNNAINKKTTQLTSDK
jgi:hypothetical protein